MKIRPVEATLFEAYWQTHRKTDMIKPTVASYNFANASKKSRTVKTRMVLIYFIFNDTQLFIDRIFNDLL